MKTIEEKAKAYDETIKRAKEWEGNPAAIDYIFPELSEFRNEKVRKALIDFFGKSANYGGQTNGVYDKDILAWLEKQGGYANFRDKAQVGDRITKNEDGVLVNLSQLKRVAKPSKKQGEKKELKKIEPKPEENNGNLGGISSNWSEEDEQHIDSLLKRLDALCRNKFERTRFAISEDRDWLKSLRHQSRWKPSELQLGCLSDAIEYYNSSGYPAPKLKELLDDLKKLKEE